MAELRYAYPYMVYGIDGDVRDILLGDMIWQHRIRHAILHSRFIAVSFKFTPDFA